MVNRTLLLILLMICLLLIMNCDNNLLTEPQGITVSAKSTIQTSFNNRYPCTNWWYPDREFSSSGTWG